MYSMSSGVSKPVLRYIRGAHVIGTRCSCDSIKVAVSCLYVQVCGVDPVSCVQAAIQSDQLAKETCTHAQRSTKG